MHVGTDEDKAIELPGGTGRQYIQLNRNRQVKFVGEKSHMEFKRILKAFSRRTQHKQLKKANFAGQVVAAYNSIDEGTSIFSTLMFLLLSQRLKKMLPLEHQMNSIENYLVLFLICPIRFRNLPDSNRPFLHVDTGDFLQKYPFKRSENNE